MRVPRCLVMVTMMVPVAALAPACTPKGKAEITEAAMEDPGRRLEVMEATLRVLDDNPAYVDELFKLTLRHPRTLDRFLENTARGVAEPDLAARVASHLVAHPRGLRRMMIETLDAAAPKRAARRAIVDALEARADLAAKILVQHPEELASVSKAIVDKALEDPDTKGKMKELVEELVTE